jgi:hypothetical protein
MHEVAAANPCYLRTELGNPQYTVLESGLSRGYSCYGKPRYLSAVCHNQVNSSTSYFTMFAEPFLFDARHYKSKTYTRRIV